MKKNNQLGYILGALYLLTATVILFRWATGISPVIDGKLLGDGRNLLEVFLLLLPILPAWLLSFLTDSANQDPNKVFTLYTFLLVALNTISWFFIGKFIQFVFPNLSFSIPLTVIKNGKIQKRTKT